MTRNTQSYRLAGESNPIKYSTVAAGSKKKFSWKQNANKLPRREKVKRNATPFPVAKWLAKKPKMFHMRNRFIWNIYALLNIHSECAVMNARIQNICTTQPAESCPVSAESCPVSAGLSKVESSLKRGPSEVQARSKSEVQARSKRGESASLAHS